MISIPKGGLPNPVYWLGLWELWHGKKTFAQPIEGYFTDPAGLGSHSLVAVDGFFPRASNAGELFSALQSRERANVHTGQLSFGLFLFLIFAPPQKLCTKLSIVRLPFFSLCVSFQWKIRWGVVTKLSPAAGKCFSAFSGERPKAAARSIHFSLRAGKGTTLA